jgi:hypothetical protein
VGFAVPAEFDHRFQRGRPHRSLGVRFTSPRTDQIIDKGTGVFVAADTANLFDQAGIDRAVAVQSDGTNTRLYVDLNTNGDLNNNDDLAIDFTGDVRAHLTSTGGFIF